MHKASVPLRYEFRDGSVWLVGGILTTPKRCSAAFARSRVPVLEAQKARAQDYVAEKKFQLPGGPFDPAWWEDLQWSLSEALEKLDAQP